MDKKRAIVGVVGGVLFVIVIVTFYRTFSLASNYQIHSDVYKLEDGMIQNISPNTSVSLYLKYFDLKNCTLKVVDDTNHEIVDGLIRNGSKAVLYDTNEKIIGSYINVIKGDFTQDGKVDDTDLSSIGAYLVKQYNLEDYQLKSADSNGDGVIQINDLIQLDRVIHSGYEKVTFTEKNFVLQTGEQKRVLANITPSYGLDRNLVWTSNNQEIAEVDESGKVIGKKEGEAIIRGITKDGTLFDEVTVKVDNTIQLSSYEGIGYVNGNLVEVGIKLIDYEGVTCSTSSESLSSCEIVDKKLMLKALGEGNSTITVTSPKYGSAEYHFMTYSTYLNVMPKYLCKNPGNIELITVSAFHAGELSFTSADLEIIKGASMIEYQGRNMLRIEFGRKQGRTTLTVKESNGNASNVIVIDNTKIAISDIGKVGKIGEEVMTTIIGEHLGELRCSSSDSEKATCRIEGNQLIITPLAIGDVTFKVENIFNYNNYEYKCGEATFMVVVQS